MKKLNPIFKRLSWLLLEEISTTEYNQRETIDFQLSYYEDTFIKDLSPKSIREALDAIDLIILHERDDCYYHAWHRMSDLYEACSAYLKVNVALFDDPIVGQGRFEENRIRTRYEHKKRVLTAFAERHGFVIV